LPASLSKRFNSAAPSPLKRAPSDDEEKFPAIMVLTASLDLLSHDGVLSVEDAAPDMEYSCALAAALLLPSVTEV
jgi:hypothetical protein